MVLLTVKHRGFGYVEFDETDDAQHAVDNMHESELFGRVLKVNLAKPNSIKTRAGAAHSAPVA